MHHTLSYFQGALSQLSWAALLPNYITSFTLDSIVSRRSSAHIRASRVQLDVTFTTKTHNVSTTMPIHNFSPVSKTSLISRKNSERKSCLKCKRKTHNLDSQLFHTSYTPNWDKKVTEKRLYHLSANRKRKFLWESSSIHRKIKKKEIVSRRQESVNK